MSSFSINVEVSNVLPAGHPIARGHYCNLGWGVLMSQGSAAATVVAALRPPPGALGAALRASEQRPPGALGRAPGGRPLLPLAPTTARGAAWGAAPSLRQRMCPAPCAARGPGSSSRGAGSGHQWSETERAEDPSESDTAADEEGSPVVVDLGSILSIREQEEGGALGSLDEEDPPHLKGFVRGSLGGGKLEERWLQRFGELVEHLDTHGEFPRRASQLGTWVNHQRQAARCDNLDDAKRELLEGIGFVWEARGEVWEERFLELLDYRETYGDCSVPSNWEWNPQLGAWVRNQRVQHRAGTLPEERARRLEVAGLQWDFWETRPWEEWEGELRAFKDEHGHCDVPQKWGGNPRLASWVASCRMRHRRGELPPEKAASLEALGFQFHVLDAAWDARFQELLAFGEEFGHLNVPAQWPSNPALGEWTRCQRSMRQQGSLSPDREARLATAGFSWEIQPRRSPWEKRFDELVTFRERFGHARVPPGWGEDLSHIFFFFFSAYLSLEVAASGVEVDPECSR
mmetsp:Transcript_58038/g.184427  ORF Transcript_58038/g.184427 Transcript_58038/m.184427 type:complete len:517 (+) Transcript_58038:730-2280(+)